MKKNLLSKAKGAAVYFAASSSLSLSPVSAAAAEAAVAAASSDLQSTCRQSSNSYASNHRALMREDEHPSEEEPDVASIINGVAIDKPLSYQVGLVQRIGDSPSCSGSLIAPRVVLTAALCTGAHILPPLDKVLINAYTYTLGSLGKIPEGNGYIDARQYAIHPGFSFATGENDIALWFLPFPVAEDEHFKFAAALNDDPNVPADDKELFVSGWGLTVDGNPFSQSPILLGTNVDYVTNEQCKADYDAKENPPNKVTAGMMCTARYGTGPCNGDYGGPLVIANGNGTGPAMDPPIQVGIVSLFRGAGCADPDYPGVYTRVSEYIDWIRSTACEHVGELCPSSSNGKSGKAKSSDLQPSHRQLYNSYKSNHRALMRDEDEKPSEEEPDPDVASIINGTATDGPLSYEIGLSYGIFYQPPIACGASLIASRVVLTAAHCVVNDDGTLQNPPKDKVLINAYGMSSFYNTVIPKGGGIIQASLPHVHPGYNPTSSSRLQNDIALLFLPYPVGEDENFRFATLNEDPAVPATDEPLFVSGWGDTSADVSRDYSPILLGTNVDYVTNEQCRLDFTALEGKPGYDTLKITDGMMCAARDGTATCSGDSGGPLVIANGDGPAMDPTIQVGIVYDYCNPNDPGIYNRVSHYVDWIRSTACQEVGELCPSSSKSSKSKSSKNDRP